MVVGGGGGCHLYHVPHFKLSVSASFHSLISTKNNIQLMRLKKVTRVHLYINIWIHLLIFEWTD